MDPERKSEKVPARQARPQRPRFSASIRSNSWPKGIPPICLQQLVWVGHWISAQVADVIAHLLRKGRAIEMIHEDLHERSAVEIGQLGDLPDDPDVAEPLDGFAVLPVLIANQHHAVYRKFRRVQRRQRQQRVIDCPQRAARSGETGGTNLYTSSSVRSAPIPASLMTVTRSEPSRVPVWIGFQ